jgi:endoglucanase
MTPLAALAALLLCTAAFADEIIFANGDRITGKIISAAEILDSAIRAMDFAEKDYAAAQAAGKRAAWDHVDTRNWAAIEMYRATGDARYHAIFLQDTVLSAPSVELFRWGEHVQRDAAFTYARLPEGLGDATLKARARQATIELADRALAYAERNAWGVTSTDPGKPQFLSFYSTGNDLDLARAHYLTGQRKYLAGLLQAQQFPLGCNPNNVVYTTGLGANPVRNPLKLDSRRTGQPAPIGLTVAGNIDFQKWGGQEWVSWPITWHLGPITTPHPLSWPTHEAFFDVYMFPAMTEYCVDWWAPNVFNWGYLAAR